MGVPAPGVLGWAEERFSGMRQKIGAKTIVFHRKVCVREHMMTVRGILFGRTYTKHWSSSWFT